MEKDKKKKNQDKATFLKKLKPMFAHQIKLFSDEILS